MWLISYARIEILSGIISFIWWFFIHFFKSWTVFHRYIYICKSVLFGFYQRFNLWKIWSLNRSCPLDVETLLFFFFKKMFFLVQQVLPFESWKCHLFTKLYLYFVLLLKRWIWSVSWKVFYFYFSLIQ